MTRRINAEEETLSSAERVITSTNQEINEQYAQYDYYEPQQMRVIPPGTDVEQFFPPVGNEWESHAFKAIAKFLKEPNKVFSFLFHTWYLTGESNKSHCKNYSHIFNVRFPNREILQNSNLS